MNETHLTNEHAINLRAYAEAGAKILNDSAAIQGKLAAQEAAVVGLTRTVTRLSAENRELRSSLEEILRLETASPNPGIRVIASLALKHKTISTDQDVDR